MSHRIPITTKEPWPTNVRAAICCPPLESAVMRDSIQTAVAPTYEPSLPVTQAAHRRATKNKEEREKTSTPPYQWGLYVTLGVEEPTWGGTTVRQEPYGSPLVFCPWCGVYINLVGEGE